MKIAAVLFSILMLLTNTALGQDRHYWDQAVGGQTGLLGGIAVAGVRDYSATFYNPGALGLIDKNKLNFSFNMYGLKTLEFENGAGPGITPKYTRVSLFPSSLAGGLPFFGDSTTIISYMIYSNGYSYVRASEKYDDYKDVIPQRQIPGNEFEGNELLINQGKIDVLLQEVSIGFGYSKKNSENIGYGVSLFGAYRDQTKHRWETYQAYDTTNQRLASTDLFVDIDYWALRFYLKFGVSAEWDEVKLGLTITTPSLAFIGGGTDGANLTSNNVFLVTDSVTNEVSQADLLASDRQEGIIPKYTSPFSAAFGIEYKLSEETNIHFAAEWFAAQNPYVVLQPEDHDFLRNESTRTGPINSADFLKVYDATKSVFNFGIALEHKLNEELTGYAAFRTDFSNADYDKIDGLTVGITDFNIYHLTIGASINLEETLVAAGVEYSHGQSSDFTQIFNFPSGMADPNAIVIASNRGNSKALYNNINIFFGVTTLL